MSNDFMDSDNDILVRLQTEIAVLKADNVATSKALAVAHDHYKIDALHVDERLRAGNSFKELAIARESTYLTKDKFEEYSKLQNRIVGGLFTVSIGASIVFQIISLIKR